MGRKSEASSGEGALQLVGHCGQEALGHAGPIVLHSVGLSICAVGGAQGGARQELGEGCGEGGHIAWRARRSVRRSGGGSRRWW